MQLLLMYWRDIQTPADIYIYQEKHETSSKQAVASCYLQLLGKMNLSKRPEKLVRRII